MSTEFRPTYTLPGSSIEDAEGADYAMVNDALGTVDVSDSTGLDEDMETGDAKTWNFPTRED
ncbi:MAG TPA: hypothetical protein VHD85_14420 [Terracidiphilus sp.]|nr:hypothetical protein [Terracidiphilus sp.]